MGSLSQTDWSSFFEEMVTYPEKDDPDKNAFGAYAMAAMGGELFMAFSSGIPMGTGDDHRGKGAMIVRWADGPDFLRAPYEAGLNAMTVIKAPVEDGETEVALWLPGTDYIEKTRDPHVASVYSFKKDPDGNPRVVDHRRFVKGEHLFGINGDARGNLYVAAQVGVRRTINDGGVDLYVTQEVEEDGAATVFAGDPTGERWTVLATFPRSRAYDVLPMSDDTSSALFVTLEVGDDGQLWWRRKAEGADWEWTADGWDWQSRWKSVPKGGDPLSIRRAVRLVDLGDGSLLTSKAGDRRVLYRVEMDGATVVSHTLPSPLQNTAIYNPLARRHDRVVAACNDGLYVGEITDLDGSWECVRELDGNDRPVGAVCWRDADRIAFSTLGDQGTVRSVGV